MKLIPLAIAALAALPLSAQVSGSVNRGAPKVMSGIEMGKAKMSLTYTSIHYAEGQWKSYKENKDRYEQFNKGAEKRPIGSITTNAAMSCSGREIPAGSYKLFFSLNDRAGGWLVNLKNDDNHIMWRLATKKSDSMKKRMHIALTAGDKNNTADFTIAFGNETMTVNLSPAKKGEDGGR